MKEILNNLALLDLINYCNKNNIDCSGTRLYKYPRRFMYSLLKEKTGRTLVTVTFYKNQIPTHFVTPE